MKLNANLKDLERQFSLCIKCKKCTYGNWPKNLPICPIYDKYKFFTYSGGGIIYLARGILLGLIEEDNYDEVLKVVSKCTSCGYCGQICKLVKAGPPYQNVTDLVRLLKINLVEQGVYLSEKHKQVIDTVKATRRPFGVSPDEEDALRGLKSEAPNKGEVLVFSGCITSYKNKENLDAVISILNKAGINYHMMDDESCCGAPLIDLGNVNELNKLAEHNLRAIQALGISQVVFLCPHCQETFINAYPQVLRKELDFEVTFITKYLSELINNKLNSLKSLHYKISYHDPCYLGRYLGDFDSARDILKKIPKIDCVEMNRNREESYCCGAGGGTKILDYDNSMAIGMERVKDFKKTGAEVLVTSCPLCKSQFRDLTKDISMKIVIKDVVEILRESLN